MRNFLIWSEEHGAWWGPNSHGYTRSMVKAGLYSATEARGIIHNANMGHRQFCEVAIPAPLNLESLKALPNGGR